MKKFWLPFSIGALGFLGTIALAATFTKFSPATGILKGSASTYVTTAASSSDLLGVIGTVPVGNGGTGLTSGTSGGVPYYSASNAITSSAALASGGVVLGGGTGAAPSTTSALTYTTGSQTLGVGNGTTGVIEMSASGAIVRAAATAATPGTIVFSGGNSSNAGAAAGGARVQGGTPTDGAGGNATLQASAGVGTNRNGGNAVIRPGLNTGSGTIGKIFLLDASANDIGTLSQGPTTGAQTATFAATNKPGAGTAGPTGWLKWEAGGTTYWIPLFGN